jgi:hypothetical protein
VLFFLPDEVDGVVAGCDSVPLVLDADSLFA